MHYIHIVHKLYIIVVIILEKMMLLHMGHWIWIPWKENKSSTSYFEGPQELDYLQIQGWIYT